MDAEELYQGLARHDLNLNNACTAIMLQTKAVINPSHLRTSLDRYGRLSEPMTAVFRFLFQELEYARKD